MKKISAKRIKVLEWYTWEKYIHPKFGTGYMFQNIFWSRELLATMDVMNWGEVNSEGMYFDKDTETKLNVMAYFRWDNRRNQCIFVKERVFVEYSYVFTCTATELFDFCIERERDIQSRNGFFNSEKPIPLDLLPPFDGVSKDFE